MNKKNGFTLVELLGVIVVLAILALITIPIISNVINDVRIKSLESSAYGLVEASNLYYAQYGNNSNIRFDIENNQISSSDTTNLLKYKGSVKEGTVILDKKGSVTVCITDGKNSAYKNYNETKVTTVKGKCEIFEGSSIVYLDGEATIDSYDNTKLTELVNSMQEEINDLKDLKENYLSNVYPVGSIYMSMTENTASKVEEKLGGTWEALENGRMIQNTTTTSGQLGGSTTATFTPTGTVGDTTLTIDQMPRHDHYSSTPYNGTTLTDGRGWIVLDNPTVKYADAETVSRITANSSLKGGSQPHTHTFTGNQTTIDTVSPYITVYMYKRTA